MSVKKIALVGGITDRISTQSIRNGAARDLAYLDADFKVGFANKAVAHGLGHATQSMSRGITDGYIGPAMLDTHTIKARRAYVDPLNFPAALKTAFSWSFSKFSKFSK